MQSFPGVFNFGLIVVLVLLDLSLGFLLQLTLIDLVFEGHLVDELLALILALLLAFQVESSNFSLEFFPFLLTEAVHFLSVFLLDSLFFLLQQFIHTAIEISNLTLIVRFYLLNFIQMIQ